MNAILEFLRVAAGQKSPCPHPLRRNVDELRIVAEDTICRTPEIIAVTPVAPAASAFHAHQLPPLNKDDCPNVPPFTV
ncbi:hypothetical protein BDM02DRAFT_1692251 [Thelephora ganbajun]|uniref:Uncharacterized protein n=1 Tax=Thelephora ganbajun TaxID=370292 RepID=A0ACB6Z0M2_THEGA|nr:hypothetical protein BDM02DRAFT_1692251 [Thelephora ganbajun]